MPAMKTYLPHEPRLEQPVVHLEGELEIPERACGLVVFAHGSGSSRFSPRNRRVAARLREAGFGTYLFDLLTPQEDLIPGARFDIALLGRRLVSATRRLDEEEGLARLALGYYGASTGAAAALVAAAALNSRVGAVVSRGGRPDLAWSVLSLVRAPTLLVVGENDPDVLELNRRAARLLRCACALEVVPGATHLFEEPGALDEVERLATAWFQKHLVPAGAPPGRMAGAGPRPGGRHHAGGRS
jgi:pimeloyl-ACP methyl ester carboxylesterase